MLENYFCAPKTLRRLRVGLSGQYIDSFADALEREGYADSCAIRYLRAAAHLGSFVEHKNCVFADVDVRMLDAFGCHFGHCGCPQPNGGGVIGYHPRFGVTLFHRHLVQLGICRSLESVPDAEVAHVIAFCEWFRIHRGASESTLRLYARGAREALEALGDDVAHFGHREQSFRCIVNTCAACCVARANLNSSVHDGSIIFLIAGDFWLLFRNVGMGAARPFLQPLARRAVKGTVDTRPE